MGFILAAIVSSLVLMFGVGLGLSPDFVETITDSLLPQMDLSSWVATFMLASVVIVLAASVFQFDLVNTSPSLLADGDQIRLAARIIFCLATLMLGVALLTQSAALDSINGRALGWLCSVAIMAGGYRGLTTIGRVR